MQKISQQMCALPKSFHQLQNKLWTVSSIVSYQIRDGSTGWIPLISMVQRSFLLKCCQQQPSA